MCRGSASLHYNVRSPYRLEGYSGMHNLRAPLVLPWLLLAHIELPQTASPPTDRDPSSTTDQVRLGEILISTPQPYDRDQVAGARKKAEQVRAAVGREGTFADIARADSQGPSAAQGGDLGCFHRALKFVRAVVTGAGTKENTVEWSISGFGCSGKSCGEMTKDAYHAWAESQAAGI